MNNIAHLDVKGRVRTIEPIMPTMRLNRSLIQKTPHRRTTYGWRQAFLNTRARQIGDTPLGDGMAVVGRNAGGSGNDLMLLLRGKKSAVDRAEAGHPDRRDLPADSGYANAARYRPRYAAVA